MGKSTFAIFGGSHIKRILNYCGITQRAVEQCLWIDPFTLYSNTDRKSKSLDKLDKFIMECSAEYLLLEISSIRMSLIKTNKGEYHRKEDVVKEIEDNCDIIDVSPLEMSNEDIEKNLNLLCEHIRGKWNPEKIILISSRSAGLVNNKVYYLLASTYWSNISKLISKCETFVYQKLKCHFLNFTQYYIPYDQMDSYEFDSFYYERIRSQIEKVSSSCSELFYDDEFNCEHRFLLAKSAFRGLYVRKSMETILDLKHPVDLCVAYSSEDFLTKYIKSFVSLRNEGYKTLEGLEMGLTSSNLYETLFLKNVLIIIKVLRNEFISRGEIKFLESDLKIGEYFCNILAKRIIQFDKSFCEKKITVRNLRHYYELEQLLRTSTNIQKLLNAELCCPTLVDIWGSCISRLIFNYADEIKGNKGRYIVNKYVFHVNPLNIFLRKTDFEQVDGLCQTEYAERNLAMQLEGNIHKYYENTESAWILVDFYALYAHHVFRCGKGFIITGNNLGRKYFPQAQCNPIFEEMSYEEIWNAMEKFVAFLRDNYQDNIILISAYNTLHYVKNNIILKFEKNEKIEKVNLFLKKIEYDFVKKTNCFYIDIKKYFMADDKEMVNLEPYHYEKELYLEEYKTIRQICEGTYYNVSKHVSKISDEIILKRFLKYREKNRSYILNIYPYSESFIWKYLIKMDNAYIEEHFKEILSLISYSSICKDIEGLQVIKLSNIEWDILAEIIKNYERK